ncbi:MAG: hypothetical protein OEL79_02855 [Chromatiales bacterium]|nr:hypothetical protein [Chromatiales bacterium]
MIGPFDARTGESVEGLTLSMPLETQIIEPLMSLSHLIFGAPNFRTALLSMGCWIFAAVLITAIKKSRGRKWFRRYFGSLLISVVAVWLLLLYTLFMMVHHIPGWTLESEDQSSAIVDFQSHTESSPDGIVSILRNLEWHKAVGFDIAAITEHWRINTKLDDLLQDNSSTLPAIIIGVEVDNQYHNYLLGLGLNPQKQIPISRGRDTREFVNIIHNTHQGAVVAMTYDLDKDHVDKLVAAGVDAIEVVNSGHPYVYADTRRKVLDVSQKYGLPLVGSTDWHGWTGFTRVWTLFQHKDLPSVSRKDRGRFVVNELRNKNRDAFTPIISGAVGGDSLTREIFTPFYEWVRYGMELSSQRLLFWWIWSAIFMLLFIKWRGVLAHGIVYGVPITLSAGIAFRAYELSQRAKLTPEGFFIRELPSQLYIAVALTFVGLFFIYMLNRKKSE